MKEAASLKAKTVAANIRKVRDLRNYTQDYLAAKLGISQNAYSKIELGYSKISLERLYSICSILEIGIVQLLEFDQDNFVKMLSETDKSHLSK